MAAAVAQHRLDRLPASRYDCDPQCAAVGPTLVVDGSNRELAGAAGNPTDSDVRVTRTDISIVYKPVDGTYRTAGCSGQRDRFGGYASRAQSVRRV